jgi:biopolymer transport protein ExbD
MTISFRCPTCGKRLKADEKRAGRTSTCPKCANVVKIPAKSDGAAEGDLADEPPSKDHGMLLLSPSKKRHEDLIDMTAMVDIVFFLLIFFMTTSMQAVESVIGLPTPKAESSSAVSVSDLANDPNYVTVTLYEDDTVWIEDEQIFGAQDLRSKLRAAKKDDMLLTGMLVVGSPEATHGTFVMVLDAGADAGISEFMFSVPDQLEAVSVGG